MPEGIPGSIAPVRHGGFAEDCLSIAELESEFNKHDDPGKDGPTVKEAAAQGEEKPITAIKSSTDMREMTPLEISALCTNLARGCEKQYKLEEAALFNELAEYFKKASAPAKDQSFEQLIALI